MVNNQKSIPWSFSILHQTRIEILCLLAALWTTQGVKYLGITLSSDLNELAELNLISLFDQVAILLFR